MNLSIYGSLSFSGDELITDASWQTAGNTVSIPCGNWSATGYKSFSNTYQNKYGLKPNVLASYAYDGMNVLIEAIKKAGTDRENIQKSLSAIHYEGVTGLIRFDGKGNRLESLSAVKILNGLPMAGSTD